MAFTHKKESTDTPTSIEDQFVKLTTSDSDIAMQGESQDTDFM